jgi:hypothetical protein
MKICLAFANVTQNCINVCNSVGPIVLERNELNVDVPVFCFLFFSLTQYETTYVNVGRVVTDLNN